MSTVLYDDVPDHALVRAFLAFEDGRSLKSAAVVYSDSKLTAARCADRSLYKEWLDKARAWFIQPQHAF